MAPPSPLLDFRAWVIFEDDHLVAVDKPAGVLSQGGEGGEGINLVDLARADLKIDTLGVLHRIDRNVSGVVLLAKTPRAARDVTMQIQKGKVERVYRAVVRGVPVDDAFEVSAWLRKDARRNEVVALDERAVRGAADFKPARTQCVLLARWRCALGACAALDVRPITGRSHQIRVHLAFAKLPIVGDPKYGVPARAIRRPLLHARAMTFVHPVTRKALTIEAPVPWSEALERGLAGE